MKAAPLLRGLLTPTREDPEYARAAEHPRRSFGPSLVYHALSRGGASRAGAAKNADVKRIAGILEEEFRRQPDRMDANEWVVLEAVGSPVAKDAGEKAKANERARLQRDLARTLSPRVNAS